MTTGTREEFRDRVRQLRRDGIDHLDVDRDVEVSPEQDHEINAAVLAYLRDNAERFVSPHGLDGGCVGCGRKIGLTFTWGIVHGRGRCSNCGWPARLYHYVEVEGRERDVRWVGMLQYHPDQMILPEDEEPETGDSQ